MTNVELGPEAFRLVILASGFGIQSCLDVSGFGFLHRGISSFVIPAAGLVGIRHYLGAEWPAAWAESTFDRPATQ